jgi:transposase
MATKLLMPEGPTALSLSQKTGISQGSLSRWVQEYKNKGISQMTEESRRPQDWSPPERFDAILTSQTLKGNELGAYLRKNGLTSSHLEKWKLDFIKSTENPKVGRKPKSTTEKELIKENKSLKRDLHRKNKALAEASALLILKKKAQAIWGDHEDDE